MRGADQQQVAMFSSVSPEARIPAHHALRAIRGMVDTGLPDLSPGLEVLSARTGRPALLLQVLYTIRSERLLMEELNARHRASAIDRRTARHLGYALSQRKRKCGEGIFGWLKTIGGLRKTRHRGGPRVNWLFPFAMPVSNLVRLRNRAGAPA